MKKSIFLFFAAILCAIGMNAATPEKLYLTPNSNWTQSNARFAAYFFGNGEKWVSMTKVAGETNLYEVTTPAGYPSVIFCRMNPGATANNWNNKWNQTGDLTVPTDGTNHYIVKDGTWDKGGGTWSIWPIPAEKTYKDITFTITASSAPQIHYWEGGDKMVGSDWENLPTMTATGNANEYTYTIKDVDEFTGVKYLFKIGDLQTADQTTSVDVTANLKDFFPQVAVMGVNNWTTGDKMTVSDDYKSASVTLTLNEIKKYALKLKIGDDWKGHKDQNHITRANNSSVFKDDDGDGSITADYVGDYVFTYTYANQTLTVTYPELPAVKTYKDIVITVVANVTPKIHYWDGGDKVVATEWETKPDMVATGAANTYSYTIKDVDEALGVKYIIVAGTAQTEDLHTTVDVTANFEELLPAVEVMGINGWNAGEGIPMTIAEDYSASATINFTEAKTQEFKLTVGGAWKGHSENNKITRANNSSVFTDNSGNASVKVDVAGDYVFTYTYSDKKLAVTYPASDEPIVPHYYIAGTENLTGFNWQVDGLEIAKDGDVYKHTFSELPAGEYEFKITDGTWDNQWNYNNLGAAYEEVSQGVDGEGKPNGNIKIVTEEAKNITVIFDATAGKITLEGLTLYVEPLTYTVTVPAGTEKCYIVGAFAQSNWNTFLEMDKVDSEDKFTITITGAKESDEYKYACQKSWDYVEKDKDGNDLAGNRTWKENDEVENWGKPVIVTYQLKGVGGWEQPGIELVQNPGNDKEYMLTCQAISATDAIKVVRLENGEIKDYYGNGTVKDGVEVTVNYDTDGNITLPEGKYNFYFDTAEPEKKLWIAAATDCPVTVTIEDPIGSMSTYTGVEENDGVWSKVYTAGDEVTIGVDQLGDGWLFAYWTVGGEKIFTEEYTFTVTEDVTITANYGMAMDVEFDNMELDQDSWVVTAGPEAGFGIELTLGIDVENQLPNGNYPLADDSQIYLGEDELELVTGYFTAIDPDAPSAEAVVIALYGEDLMAFVCTMTAAPAPALNIVVENATLTNETGTSGFLYMNSTWSDGTETYPVQAEIPGFTVNAASATYAVTLTVGGRGDDDPWLGSAEGKVSVTVNNGLVTVTGLLENAWTGFKADVTISGTLTKDYTRTVTAGNFGTICLPFGGEITGAVLYECVGRETDSVLLGSVETLDAGVPYIFLATGTELAVYSDGTTAATPGDHNGLHGTFTDDTEVTTGNYILYNNELCQAEATCYVNANCAYLVMSEVPTEPVQQMPGRRYIGLDVHGENGTTGLDNITTGAEVVKTIENGQLIIIRGGEKFNAQGVRL